MAFGFAELAGLFYQNIQVFFLLGSFGGAKEMNESLKQSQLHKIYYFCTPNSCYTFSANWRIR